MCVFVCGVTHPTPTYLGCLDSLLRCLHLAPQLPALLLRRLRRPARVLKPRQPHALTHPPSSTSPSPSTSTSTSPSLLLHLQQSLPHEPLVLFQLLILLLLLLERKPPLQLLHLLRSNTCEGLCVLLGVSGQGRCLGAVVGLVGILIAGKAQEEAKSSMR